MADFNVNVHLRTLGIGDSLADIKRLQGALKGLNGTATGGGVVGPGGRPGGPGGSGAGGRDFFANSRNMGANLAIAAGGVRQLTRMTKAAVGSPLALATGFQSVMLELNAVSGGVLKTEGQLKRLSVRARELGSSTEFTATQAGQAFVTLQRAGWGYEQQLASISPVLDLATTGHIDMARSADIVVGVLNGFNLEATEARDVMDVMAKASRLANTDVVGLASGMKQVAPIAKELGFDIRDTATALNVLANSGFKGAQGGTALKMILGKLASQTTGGATKKAKRAFLKMGLSRKDLKAALDSGDIGNVFELMQQKLAAKGIGGSDKAGIIGDIFGMRHGTKELKLMDAMVAKGAKGFRSMQQELANTSGESAKMATEIRSGAQGSINSMNSALQELGIVIGEEVMPDFIELIGLVTTATRDFGKWAGKNPELSRALMMTGGAIVVVGTVLAPVLLSLSALATIVGVAGPAIAAMGSATALAAAPYAALALGAIALGVVLADQIDTMGELNVQWATLNALKAEGLGLDIGIAEKRGGVARLGDLSPEDQDRLKTLTAHKEAVGQKMLDVNGPLELLDQVLSGGAAPGGMDDLTAQLQSDEAEIARINKRGIRAGRVRVDNASELSARVLAEGRTAQSMVGESSEFVTAKAPSLAGAPVPSALPPSAPAGGSELTKANDAIASANAAMAELKASGTIQKLQIYVKDDRVKAMLDGIEMPISDGDVTG